MKKITKFLFSLATAALIASNVTSMASCGADEWTNTKIVTGEVNSVAYDGSEVTISFYHTMGGALRQILDNHIPRFNEMYPNIKVVHSTYGDYPGLRDQITTEISGDGTAPSLAYCYPDHVALYNKTKAVLTLDDFIANAEVGFTEEDIADFVPAYYNEGKVYGDGKMYTLPMLKSTELLYYNATVFEAKGYEVPTTWDEMEALCARIKADVAAENEGKPEAEQNKVIPLGYDSEANWFITMCEQQNEPYTSVDMASGSHFLFNTEKNREQVARFRDWYEKSYVTTEQLNGKTYTSNLFKETKVSNLKSYMCIGSSAGASYQCPTQNNDGSYPFEVGVAMIPQYDPQSPKMISQGPSICMFKKANEQEMAAAWLFAKFLTTDIQLQGALSLNNGYSSAVQSVVENQTYANQLAKADGNANLQATCINKTIDMRDYYYVSPAFYGSSAARDEVGLLMQDCLSKDTAGKTVAQFIADCFADRVSGLSKKYDKK